MIPGKHTSQQYNVYIFAIVSMIFWGMSFVWTSIVLKYYQPITTIFLRLVLASLIMFSIIKISGKLEKIKKEDWKLLLLMSFFNPFLYFLGENFGLKLTTPTISAVIIALIPVLTPVFAYIFLREKLTKFNYIGIFISFLGILLMLVTSNFTLITSVEGVLLLFFAVFSAIFYSIVLLKLASKYNPLTLITWQNIIGLVYFTPVFFIFEADGFLEVQLNTELVVSLLCLAVFASSLAFIFFAMVIRRLGVSRANVYSNLIPIFTAIFSFFIIGEQFTSRKVIGMVIVIGGVFLAQIRFNKKLISKNET